MLGAERPVLLSISNKLISFSFQFEQRFSVAYSASQSLLTEINSTLVDLEEGLMCFDTAKNEAQNASNTARMAFNISKKAKEVSLVLLNKLKIVGFQCLTV